MDRPQRRFAAVLFDLDGTLLDTLADIADSANSVLTSLGFAAQPIDAYRQFVGEGVRVLFQRALPAGGADRAMIDRCAEAFREAYGRMWNVHTRPYAGIPEMLDELARRRIPMAVLSNKPDAFVQRCVQAYLPRYPFQTVLGQRDGVPRKPDPAGAREACAALGVRAEQVVYVGDSAIDMQTAVAAGAYPVGVRWGFRSEQELRDHGAQAIIAHPADLLAWF